MKSAFLLLLISLLFIQFSTTDAQIRNDIVVIGKHDRKDGSTVSNNVVVSQKDGEEVAFFDDGGGYDFKGVACGDYDGDGHSEIAVFRARINDGSRIDRIIVFNLNGSVYSNGSAYSDFYAGDVVLNINNINHITSADVNNDGIDEIVISCSEGTGSLYNNLVAFTGTGELVSSNFDYPGGYDFAGIAGGNFDIFRPGEEIAIYEHYHTNYDRIIMYADTLSYFYLYCYTNDTNNYKLLSISGGDIDGDNQDDIVATSDNKVVIYRSTQFLKEFSLGGYDFLGVSCRDFDDDDNEDIAVYRSYGDSNPSLHDFVIVFDSEADGTVLSAFRYSDLTNPSYSTPQITAISSGTLEPNYPLLYIDDDKVDSLDNTHDFYTGVIKGAENYLFWNALIDVVPDSFGDKELHDEIARNFKYMGVIYQVESTVTGLSTCLNAFNEYANRYESAYDIRQQQQTPRQEGVFLENLLYESYWLEEICWAYDLLHDAMSQTQRNTIRNKLLRLAAKRQTGYYAGRNNHTDAHNLAIAAAGFILHDGNFLQMAYKGYDISEDPNLNGEWRGINEQLQNDDYNNPVTFDYSGYDNSFNDFSNIGNYLPDFTQYEGTISYAYHDIGHLVRTLAMAKNNYYYNVNDHYSIVDNMAKSFVSTIFPFYPAGEDIGINFPAINDDFLQGLTTVSFLEILHSEFYPSGQSPYATILLEDQDTFDNFIFSDIETNYTPLDDDELINASINLSHGGWGILRSSQDIDDRNKLMALMDYGPYGGNNHGHADRFNIILYSNFDDDYKELIGDRGRIRDTDGSKISYLSTIHNKYVRSTISHNTILINNNRQADPNTEAGTKCQLDLPLYGGSVSSEADYANKKCNYIKFDSDDSDSLQYILARAYYGRCYGDSFQVTRTLAMIADKYIVDMVNIRKRYRADFKFVDWVIHGPTSDIGTDQIRSGAGNWDWERGDFSIADPNESYNYFYEIDTTALNEDNWKTWWVKDSGDTLLKIWNINKGNQRLITALSPDSSTKYDLDPLEIKASLIARRYDLFTGSDYWRPEFLAVMEPNGVPSIQDVHLDTNNDQILVIETSDGDYYFDYRYLDLGLGGLPKKIGEAKLDNLPMKFRLSHNYPNPFNPTTIIPFALPKDSHVKIEIYNILGQKIKVLTDEIYEAGFHQITFVTENQLASGIYFINATMREMENKEKVYEFKQKIMLIR